MVHQALDYVFGLALLATGLREARGPWLVVAAAGCGLVLLALVTDAPLGVRRRLGRRAHVGLEALVILGLMASPLASSGRVDVVELGVAEGAAVLLARFLLLADASTPVRAAAVPASPRAATGAPGRGRTRAPTGVLVRVGARRLGRTTGRIRSRARSWHASSAGTAGPRTGA